MKRFVGLCAALGSLALGGCDPVPNETQIVSRARSPDGKLEAIHALDVGGGAAVGTTEEIFIVNRGNFPRLKERVFSKECAHNLEVRWVSSQQLEVTYRIASDIRDGSEMIRPSLFSILSSGYWTYKRPHDVKVQIRSTLAPAGSGC